MPTSNPEVVPLVHQLFDALRPSSILDVGIGFGLWGALFRAWSDVRAAELEPDRYWKWKTRIVGVESYRPYVSALYQLYDRVLWGDALSVLTELPEEYDFVFLGDIIEHFTLEEGARLLDLGRSAVRSGGLMAVTTPRFFRPQAPVMGNPREEHLSFWHDYDLKADAVEHLERQKVAVWRI